MNYKGFEIRAQPYQLHDTQRWTIDLEIWRGGRKQHFSLRDDCATERDAELRCTQAARRIIDGGAPGYSVRHLPGRGRKLLRMLLLTAVVLGGLAACAGMVRWSMNWDTTALREWF